MQSGDEGNAVVGLNFVVEFAEQLPIGVIDQHENSRPHRISLHEQLQPLCQQIILQVLQKLANRP